MQTFTLRQKFKIGLAAVAVVALGSMLSVRLLGKAALFHYLEREHLAIVLKASALLDRAAEGGSRAGTVSRTALIDDLERARELATRADSELFAVEQAAFRLVGFGAIMDLPRKDIGDLERILGHLRSAGVSTIDRELAARLQPDMATVIDNSDRFGPLVAEATAFVKASALAINLAAVACVLVAFLMLRRATLSPLHQAMESAQRVASGDLSAPPAACASDEVGRLNAALDEMKANLSRIVGDVRERSRAVASSMAEVTSGGQDLSSRTERQAATLQQTVASMRELNLAVHEGGERVREADRIALQARDVAREGGEAVSRVVTRMNQILEASRKIADINRVIDGIAFQTNILALNAAVEAARAGEQGRGFAVVASEVRSLAQRSASAAKEIASLIGDTVEKVESGATEVGEAGQTIERVVQTVARVSSLTTEVAGSLAVQVEGITQIDAAMQQLDEATQQNAALAEQSVSAAESVRGQATALVDTVGQFRLGATA